MLDDAGVDAVFYKYKDAQGREVLTNDLKTVPPGTRVVEVHPSAAVVEKATTVDDVPGSKLGVHLPSAGLGAGLIVAVLTVAWGWRRMRWLFRIAAVLFAIAFIGALYFGWVLRSAGLSNDTVASPGRAVDEASAAAARANARAVETQRALERLED